MVAIAKGRVCNQTELAEILGVSDVTLWEWQKLGMPIMKRGARGQENLYDTAAVIGWKIDHEVTKVKGPESAKDRLARLQADKVWRELQQMDRLLIPAHQLEPFLLALTGSIGKGLDTLEHKLAAALEAKFGADIDLDIVKEEIDDVRGKLPDDIVERVTSGLVGDAAAGSATAASAREDFVG